jgi:hypothetical protein
MITTRLGCFGAISAGTDAETGADTAAGGDADADTGPDAGPDRAPGVARSANTSPSAAHAMTVKAIGQRTRPSYAARGA